MRVWGTDVMILAAETELLRKNPVRVPLFQPKIPCGLAWYKTNKYNLGFHKKRVISSPPAQLFASQKELCSMESVTTASSLPQWMIVLASFPP